MSFSITVKLPKSKTQQYDMPGPISINDISNTDFVENILKKYENHIQLSNNLSQIKNGLNEVLWGTLSPEKINIITNFYFSNPISFADVNTYPGENGTVNWKDGIYRFIDIKPKISKSDQAYRNLGINPMPIIRSNNNNFNIPNYEVNPLYLIKAVVPDAFTYEKILEQLIVENKLVYPLAQHRYNATKPEYYPYNGAWYVIPHYNTLINGKNQSLLDIYNKFSEAPIINEFKTDEEAWKQFLSSLPKSVRSEKSYDDHIMTIETKMYSSFPGTQGKQIPVYIYNNEPFFVMSYATLQKFPELFNLWYEKVILGKTIFGSFADEAFRQLALENPFKEIITDGLRFEAFYKCKNDPRWEKFINEKYYKIPENASEEQIEKIKEEIRIKSPRLFLFSSVKPIKKTVIDENGKIKHCFNLSNEYFEKIPDGEWKRCMSALANDPRKIYEFVIWCETAVNGQCVLWKGESRTPTARGEIKTHYFDFLHDKGMNESAYSIDAALVDENNQIQYIIEFDGIDHFFSKRENGNPTGKIVSDQVKNRFARDYNIPCIRIPGFDNKRNLKFIDPFKKHIINIIRSKYNLPPLEQETETTNPGIYQKSPD